MGRTRTAPPPPDPARAHIERPPRPRAAGSRSAQCGGGARVPGAPRAAPRAAGAGRRGQSGPVSPPPAQVAVIAGGWRCARVRLHCRRRRGRKVRGAACGSGLGGQRRRTAFAVLGYGSRNLDSPPEVSRSLHPNFCWTPSPSPPSARDPIAPTTPATGPTSRARRWVPSLRGFVCGPSGTATGFSASQGRPLFLHRATPRSSLPAPPPAESLSTGPRPFRWAPPSLQVFRPCLCHSCCLHLLRDVSRCSVSHPVSLSLCLTGFLVESVTMNL